VGCCSGQNCWGLFQGLLCLACPCTYIRQVREVEDGVVFVWGEYQGTLTQPGLYCINPSGVEIKTLSRQKQSLSLLPTKIVDKLGNPLLVSGIVVFYYSDTKKIAIEIRDPFPYVANAAQAVLKKVVSKYPFESAKQGQMCLRLNSKQISKDLTTTLSQDLQHAGVTVISFQFNELSYATEIAQGMLKRQQAQAMIAARTKIVSGALNISLDAVEELEKQGMGVKAEDKARIITNLLTLISSENEGQTGDSEGRSHSIHGFRH